MARAAGALLLGTLAFAWAVQAVVTGAAYVPVSVTENAGVYQATFDTGLDSCDYNGNTSYTVEGTNSAGTSVASNDFLLDLESVC